MERNKKTPAKKNALQGKGKGKKEHRLFMPSGVLVCRTKRVRSQGAGRDTRTRKEDAL